jgi:hypothetical protein
MLTVECGEDSFDLLYYERHSLNLTKIEQKNIEIISISETWHPKTDENTIDVEYMQDGKTMILDIDRFNNMLEA